MPKKTSRTREHEVNNVRSERGMTGIESGGLPIVTALGVGENGQNGHILGGAEWSQREESNLRPAGQIELFRRQGLNGA